MSDVATQSRCSAPNTPGHNNGPRCSLPAHVGGLCKRHAKKFGVTKLCMQCGVWHVPGEHGRARNYE